MICPSGAVENTDLDQFEREKSVRHSNFEVMLDRDKAERTFRRLIPVDQVGFDTLYVFWHTEHPYLKVPKDNNEI